METTFMTQKTVKLVNHTIFSNFPQGLHLKSSNKHVALQYLSSFYTWKNIKGNTTTIKSK